MNKKSIISIYSNPISGPLHFYLSHTINSSIKCVFDSAAEWHKPTSEWEATICSFYVPTMFLKFVTQLQTYYKNANKL